MCGSRSKTFSAKRAPAPPPAPSRMRCSRASCVAAGAATQDALEQRMRLGAGGGAGALLAEKVLDLLPHIRGEDGLMLAGVDFLFVFHLAQVDGAGEQVVQAALGKPLPAPKVPLARLPALGQPVSLLQLLDHGEQPLVFQVQLEDGPHPDRLFFVDHQLGALYVVTQERLTAYPLAFPAGGGDLVPRPLRNNLPLELGKSTFKTSRPMEVAVLNIWVTDTNATWRFSKASMILAKSSRERLSLSTLYTTRQSIRPLSTSARSCLRAGRSRLPPVKPPSS